MMGGLNRGGWGERMCCVGTWREVEGFQLGEWLLPLPGVWVHSYPVDFPFVYCTIRSTDEA